MNLCKPLGTSAIDIPFAFPDSAVADTMSLVMGAEISPSEAERVLVIYWNAIDAGEIAALPPAAPSHDRGAMANFLTTKGISITEAAAFITGLMEQGDPIWLSPNWSYTTDIVRGTKTAVKNILSDLPWGKILLVGGGIFFISTLGSAVVAGASGLVRPRARAA